MATGILNSLDRFETRVRVFKKYLSSHIAERKHDTPFSDRPDWDDVEAGIWMTDAVLNSIDDSVSSYIALNYSSPPSHDVWEPIYKYTRARYQKNLELHEELKEKCNIWLMWIDASRTLIERVMIEPAKNFHFDGDIHMGDVNTLIGSGTLISKSIVQDSMNKLVERGETDAANIIAQVGKIVNDSNNVAAATLYEGLAKHVAQGSAGKSATKQFWDMLVASVPSLAKLSIEFGKIFLGGPDVPIPPAPTISV